MILKEGRSMANGINKTELKKTEFLNGKSALFSVFSE